MDPSTSSLLARPRLRLLRNPSPSPRIPDGSAETTPQPAPRSLFPTVHDEEDELPTPRIHPKHITDNAATPLPTDTPAARLRALLARESRSPSNTTPAPPPAPSSDVDSVADMRFGSSTSSVTRESLKDIFSRALREPGDTPQKGRLRRNSFDTSSLEITPVVDRDKAKRKAARRSLSDEEAEKPKSNRQPDPSFRLSTAATFDTLRTRLGSSQSQIVDQNIPETLYDSSTSIPNSQLHPQASASSSQFDSTHAAPTVNTSTWHPSFQMYSQLAFQSNLLDQDSEMQRAMGDVLTSDNEASTSAPNVAQPAPIPSNSRPSSSLKGDKDSSQLGHRHAGYEFDPSTTSSFVNGGIAKDKEHRSQEGERNHQREREWNRPRLSSQSGTPEVHRRHSQEFHRRLSQEFRSPSHTKSFSHESVAPQSSATGPARRHSERRDSPTSLRSFDEHSSSSVGSQADYRDQILEHEREREWNKRHPSSRPSSRPSSSLSTSSNQSFSHSFSHSPRPPSATAYLTPTHASLQRKSSRASIRSDSPASSLASSRDSLKEREQEGKKEVSHERERNWNSPRPHWSTSKSPSTSHLRIRSKDDKYHRTSSSPTHSRDPNGHRDASWVSTKLRSTLPEVNTSSAMSSALLHKSGDRSDAGLHQDAAGTTQSVPLNGFSPTPSATSKFGWNFARNPLPPLELDDPSDRRKSASSPTPGSQPSHRALEAVVSSQIPVRSRTKNSSGVSHMTSDMSLTHVVGDESSFHRDNRNRSTEIVAPGRREPLVIGSPRGQESMILASDEESIIDLPQSTTPKSQPPNPVPKESETDSETEVLTSPSPQGSPRLGAPASIPDEVSVKKANDPSPEEPFISETPPGTPPAASTGLPTSELSPSFVLGTPPRQTSLGSPTLDFRTPSPPHDLPDLPSPPSPSDDDALGGTPIRDWRVNTSSNFTLTKTPKPPGAWSATPLPPKLGHRSSSPTAFLPLESTPPASTSTPLPRANSHPHTRTEIGTDSLGEDGLLTPVGTLPRARSLPLRTPAPPGAWMATPGQSALLNNGVDQSQYGSLGRRKSLLKVRFDVTESEASATEGHTNSPVSAIRLTNPGLLLPKPATDRGTDNDIEAVVHDGSQPTLTSVVSHRPVTPERPTTPIFRENGPSPRSLRKSPSVRLVDAYGRERVNEEGAAEPSINLPNGHADTKRKTTTPPSTPGRSLVRIVDAMGRGVGDVKENPDALKDRGNRLFEADVSVASDDFPVGHAEALTRMRKTLRDLAESLSETDRSEDLELNSTHLEQLEEVSRAARLARNQLAQNLHVEKTRHHDLHHNKFFAWTRGLLPVTPKKSWNTTMIYCGVIIQLLFFLAMWRYAHAEAHRLFYTTYYDPLYPEFTPVQESACLSGTLPASSRLWTMFDSYETIRREGWRSIRREILHAMRHIGDQAWERWGERVHFEKPT